MTYMKNTLLTRRLDFIVLCLPQVIIQAHLYSQIYNVNFLTSDVHEVGQPCLNVNRL